MGTTSPTNGVAKKPATKKTTVKPVETKIENSVVKMADETLKKMVSFQHTVEKVNELQQLVEDYTKITDTLKNIGEFNPNGSGESIQFQLNDFSRDNVFMTYNTNLINQVISILTTKMKEKQTELIDKILNFTI